MAASLPSVERLDNRESVSSVSPKERADHKPDGASLAGRATLDATPQVGVDVAQVVAGSVSHGSSPADHDHQPITSKPATRLHTLADKIPTVCTIADVCRILQISQSTYFLLKRKGTFPIPELQPPVDSRPRFAGIHVQQYLEGRVVTPRRKRVA
jgi:hypothetical protein